MHGQRLIAAAGAALLIGTASAQSIDDAIEIAQETNEQGAETQDQVDRLEDQREELLRQYRAELEQIERLQRYNDQQRQLIESQEREISLLETQIEQVTTIKRDVAPMMVDMLAALERIVDNDIPFFREERQNRIERLKSQMDRADVTESEKYRVILQGFQIEADYGRAIESYDGALLDDPENRQVTYVKYGRLALVYITNDLSEAGIWNRAEGGWEPLPSNYIPAIRMAERIAKEQIPPDLVEAPVPGPRDAAQN
jgi:predicted RNase H-like nuclease (RuvC/YqgF family)